MGKCLIMPNHAALKLEANLSLSFQPWFPPNKHKSPFLNSTHEHTLVDITIQTILESDTAIFLKPDFNITSIYCFVPLLHCRLDLKAISANARAWSIYDSCWFVSKLSSAFGGRVPFPSFPEPPHTQEPPYPSPYKDGTRRTLDDSGYRRLPLSQLLLDLRQLWQTKGCFFYKSSMQTRSTHQWRFAFGHVRGCVGSQCDGQDVSYLISCMSQWDHTPWWLDCKAASDHLDAPHWLGTRAPVGWQLHRWLSSSRSSHSPNPSRHLGDSTISGKKLPSIAQYNMSKAKLDCSIDTWSTRSCETGEELSLCHLGHQAYSTHCISVGSP